MRERVTSVLEVVSAGAITAGAGLWSVTAGLVVAGVFGLAFARGARR